LSWPVREVYVTEFYLDPTEVSNAQYAEFVEATGHRTPSHWVDGKPSRQQLPFPVVNVSLDDARAYAAWAGKRLPTETEWERAARGPAGTRYPWGDEWQGNRANVAQGRPQPVKSSAKRDRVEWSADEGSSEPFVLLHLAGNVMEWTDSPLTLNEGAPFSANLFPEGYYVAKGGAHSYNEGLEPNPAFAASAASRHGAPSSNWYFADNLGFRCAANAE
jgi:formylglycine-generating enzyme required for sulfatase activity